MNKSLITNLLALSITVSGIFMPIYSVEIFMAGLFSLSGGITNWLAIHMLFEKVPFLYGSGVIPERFKDFKIGIKKLIMNEFFSKESLESFIKEYNGFDQDKISEKLDYEKIFNKLVEAIEESSLGSVLKMVGGKESLSPLRVPVEKKIKEVLNDLPSNNIFSGKTLSTKIIEDVETIIDKRLEELTPQHIKSIIKEIIHKHLGWLVVWGGIFGFVIGIIIGVIGI
tara:strand:+ start:148 stop:825 length:678 start_codon:yes stop_codon:yes gene_type:complete